MKNIITAIGFLAFMASCSSSGEQPIDSNMDASVTQDDSVYKEESSNSSKEISSADKSVETGLALIEGNDCRTCHQNDTKLIGPSYKEVAERYSEEDIDLLITHIINGSVGIWGEVPMTPHLDLSENDAKLMVKYILSLKD